MDTAASKNPPHEPASYRGVVPTRLSDAALAARAAGDEAAFTEIVRRYREPLRRHAARYVGDADAEDIAQQALVKASLALRKETTPEIDLRPWLYRVTTNVAIDHQRAAKVRPLGDRAAAEPDGDRLLDDRPSDPHDVMAGREAIRAVVGRMTALAPKQRRAATARFLEGRSHDEIAAELGVTRGAARELVHRARRQLREAIPALAPAPLLGRLRDAVSGWLAGAGATPAAKLAVGAAVVAAASGGGAAVLHAERSGRPSVGGAAPTVVEPANFAALPPVAAEPRQFQAGKTSTDGKTGADGPSGSTGGTAAGAHGGTGGARQQSVSVAPSGSPGAGGSPSQLQVTDAVGKLADDLGVGKLADDLGISELTDQLQVPGADDLGVDGAGVPNAGGLLDGR